MFGISFKIVSVAPNDLASFTATCFQPHLCHLCIHCLISTTTVYSYFLDVQDSFWSEHSHMQFHFTFWGWTISYLPLTPDVLSEPNLFEIFLEKFLFIYLFSKIFIVERGIYDVSLLCDDSRLDQVSIYMQVHNT